MTSTIIFRQPDAISILTDTAAYDANGTVRHFYSKSWPIAHLGAVVAGSGPVALTALLLSVGAEVQTCDDLRAAMPGLAERACSEPGLDHPWVVYVAGFLRSGVADTFAIANHESRPEAGTTYQKFTVIDLPALVMSPGDASMRGDIDDVFAGADPDEEVIPAVHGLALMQVQRRRRAPDFSGNLIHAIGGHCQLTTVHRDGISTQILKRWPDRIGEKIDPGADPVEAPADPWHVATNKGPRPPGLRRIGTPWLDDSVSPWVLKSWDGLDWIETATVDPDGPRA